MLLIYFEPSNKNRFPSKFVVQRPRTRDTVHESVSYKLYKIKIYFCLMKTFLNLFSLTTISPFSSSITCGAIMSSSSTSSTGSIFCCLSSPSSSALAGNTAISSRSLSWFLKQNTQKSTFSKKYLNMAPGVGYSEI